MCIRDRLGVDLPSFFISSTADLKMRIERPRLRAASGSRFQPKRTPITKTRMTMCQGSIRPLPMGRKPSVIVKRGARQALAGGQQISVYVFGPRWAGRGETLLSRTATGGFDAIALPACRGRIGKDRELFRRSDPLTEQLHLTLHSVKATLGGGQLGAELLGLAPQRPDPRTEVDASHQEQAHPDHQPPPHEADPTRSERSARPRRHRP